ncbi:UDP-N-acetylglucosamine pyrophosphorylase, partial [bacterium]
EKLVEALKSVKLNKKKKEYYLTDVISILYSKNELVETVDLADACEGMGVNSQKELAKAISIMRQRINDELMDSGITITDPQTTFIDYGVKIGRGTVIYPFTVIEKNVKIGKNCYIGPFVHLREDTQVKDNVTLGNFLEVARSRLDSGIFIKHFGYIGDARLGRSVNIGAGTVTANFDGKNKNTTVIEDGAFIGSDTILVAPVRIGKSAVTGAGAVVLKDSKVPAGEVVVGVPARLLKKRK